MISYIKCFNDVKLGLLQKKKYLYLKNIKKNRIIVDLLIKYNIIMGYKTVSFNKKNLILIYLNNNLPFFCLKNLSKINNFKTLKLKDLKKLHNKNSYTKYILSTSKGLLNIQEALNIKIGGKLVFRIN